MRIEESQRIKEGGWKKRPCTEAVNFREENEKKNKNYSKAGRFSGYGNNQNRGGYENGNKRKAVGACGVFK